jgi:hypothetical protein
MLVNLRREHRLADHPEAPAADFRVENPEAYAQGRAACAAKNNNAHLARTLQDVMKGEYGSHVLRPFPAVRLVATARDKKHMWGCAQCRRVQGLSLFKQDPVCATQKPRWQSRSVNAVKALLKDRRYAPHAAALRREIDFREGASLDLFPEFAGCAVRGAAASDAAVGDASSCQS